MKLIKRNYLLFNLYQVMPYVYTTTHCSLKAYCAIVVRRSNFSHQASPRVSPRKSTQRRKVGEKCPDILPKCRRTLFIYMP
jgi:hypothetical protein